MGVYETKNLIRPDADVGQNLGFFSRKETRNLYWNRIFSDKINDSHNYVFFQREKTNSPIPSSPFPLLLRIFLGQIIKQQFLAGTPKWVYETKNLIRPIRTRSRIQIFLFVTRRTICTGTVSLEQREDSHGVFF